MALSSVTPRVSPGIIRWGTIFCAKSPNLGDKDLSNRFQGSVWGTEWRILVAPWNSYVNNAINNGSACSVLFLSTTGLFSTRRKVLEQETQSSDK